MPTILKIKQELLEYLDGDPVASVCLQIVDYAARQKAENLVMLTYWSIAKGVGVDIRNPLLIMAVHTLVLNKKYHLLDKHYLLKDFDGSDKFISDEVVRRAYSECALVLSDGSVVNDVDSHLIPYFSASELLLEAKAVS